MTLSHLFGGGFFVCDVECVIPTRPVAPEVRKPFSVNVSISQRPGIPPAFCFTYYVRIDCI